MNVIELGLFASRIEAVCEEMGAVLRRSAFSPNIRDRLDYSCAIFDAEGQLCAQAAHIPVHLGSMAYAMRDIVGSLDWQRGDMVVVNDPFLGGTHLPDVTLIAPVFVPPAQGEQLLGFVANRAHHADIGGSSPGSMPISRTLAEEGIIIPPSYLLRAGKLNQALLDTILASTNNRDELQGDFAAQISANYSGVQRLAELVAGLGVPQWQQALNELNDYAERLSRAALRGIPSGEYRFGDCLDDDGLGNTDLAIVARLQVDEEGIRVDFSGTAAQTSGNVNCPLSVAAAGVYYVFRCLMPPQTPACAGAFRPISIRAPLGCLLNAERPAAVAAGNVETSSRVVDVICGALAQAIPALIPAASHGSMNNLAMGARGERNWDYYETIGGGMGAGPLGGGLDALQTHMTNTLNTPIEVLERNYPLRLRRYAIRRGSGGVGKRNGGDGLLREFEFLAPSELTLLTERRRHAPWGLAGGGDGACGENHLNGELLPGKCSVKVEAGDRLSIATPGGGGWGKQD
ncbi:MAG: hydantoinase B/oxoprolinase family protein [Gammaproteobacteria bacterium]|nr:hydantoinase B/oxoprolinase family protein [Gammaproteobacteria bacterium]